MHVMRVFCVALELSWCAVKQGGSRHNFDEIV